MDAVFVRFILFLFVRYAVINLLNLLYAVHKIPDNYYHPLFFCRLHKRKAAKEKPAVFFLLYGFRPCLVLRLRNSSGFAGCFEFTASLFLDFTPPQTSSPYFRSRRRPFSCKKRRVFPYGLKGDGMFPVGWLFCAVYLNAVPCTKFWFRFKKKGGRFCVCDAENEKLQKNIVQE